MPCGIRTKKTGSDTGRTFRECCHSPVETCTPPRRGAPYLFGDHSVAVQNNEQKKALAHEAEGPPLLGHGLEDLGVSLTLLWTSVS